MAVIYMCPADKRLLCSWEGYASDIKQHFEKEHNGLLFHTNTIEIDLNTSPENRLVCLEDECFLIQSDIQENVLRLRMRYLGSSINALKIAYDVEIIADSIVYKYETHRRFSSVIPRRDGWEVNLHHLEDIHGALDVLKCRILLNTKLESIPSRKFSECTPDIEELEKEVLEGLHLVEERLEELHQMDLEKQSEVEARTTFPSGDLMDRDSVLNLEILEQPFTELNLTCTSCKLDMLPPIYLCLEGHNICSNCRKALCKLCGSKITDTRNRDLENISRTHKHPCRYHHDGCNEKFSYNEIRAHEARCLFCKYKCSNECHFEGRYLNFLNHLKIVHSSTKIINGIEFEFPKNCEVYVVDYAIGIFYCYSKQKHDSISWTAEFCGPRERSFFCEIEFKASKYKEKMLLKHRDNLYEISKSISELKKMKAKDKNAFLTITTYDT